jgi:hypothetical protein
MPIQTPRKEFTQQLPKWTRCADVLAGSDAVKAAGTTYLPKIDGQTQKEYQAYLDRALFYNGTARTRSALVGSVFRKDLEPKLPDALSAVVTPDLQDVTLEGTPLNDFGLTTLEAVIGKGRYGILVDMPDETTPEDVRRPYWVAYEAEQIINWRKMKRGADYVTSLIVLKECVDEDDARDEYTPTEVLQYRELRLVASDSTFIYRQRVFRKSGQTGNFIQHGLDVFPKRRGVSLDFIPFVVVNPSDVRLDVEKPPLLDMVDVNLSHYRSSADLEHGERFTALPTPWVNGLPTDTKKIMLGPTQALILRGPNAGAGFLEFKGEGLKQLEKALDRKAEQMAVLGARLIEQARAQAETAESVKARHAASHATLKVMAGTVGLALTMALRWHVWWAGFDVKPDEVTVELNKEFFEVVLSAEDVKSEVLRWQAGACSFETLYYNLTRGGRTRPGVTFDEEKKLIDGEEQDRLDKMAELGLGDPNDPAKGDKGQRIPPKAA